jgi:CheY-like chemotaxis protein
MFSQAAQPINDPTGGLGLGLMFARNLAELHGGSLIASSSGPGKGSEFILHLPIEEEVETAKEPTEEPSSKNIKIKKWKIIVVDDNITLANLMGKLLHALDQEVTVAYDGASVVELVKVKKPDLIFIDISMPEMNGYDLAKILRNDSRLEKTKMMALSGFGEEYRQRSMEAGFDDHLIKPISINDLEVILARLDSK